VAIRPTDSTLALRLPAVDRAPASAALEEEVVALFDLLRDRMLRYLLAFNLPVQDAEEVIQEVFLALFQHLKRGKSRANLRGWLFRVAHNLALKRRERQHRNCSRLTQDEHLLVDPAPTAEDRLASSQRQARLQAVLNALPEQDQRCLTLRAEGLRYREIAEVLGISLGGVAQSLGRSFERLGRADER
jgi:RNA polymerase sigma-70 factor (ECF subfamily)